jgi:hypothetical protein
MLNVCMGDASVAAAIAGWCLSVLTRATRAAHKYSKINNSHEFVKWENSCAARVVLKDVVRSCTGLGGCHVTIGVPKSNEVEMNSCSEQNVENVLGQLFFGILVCWHQLRQTRARALAHERCSAHPACWTTTNIVATQKTRRVSKCKSVVRVLHVDVHVASNIAPNASGHNRQCTTPITVMDRTARRSPCVAHRPRSHTSHADAASRAELCAPPRPKRRSAARRWPGE